MWFPKKNVHEYCLCLGICCVLWLWQALIYFFPITPLHTCGSFTFMVIQIMKLSIRGILWWEQWTQLPPAACEMGWQTPRQMGEAALGRQSNHIHLASFPFPLFMCSAATYQQAGAKEPGIITSHTPTTPQTLTHAQTHSLRSTRPRQSPPLLFTPLTCTSGFSLPWNTSGEITSLPFYRER